MVERKARFTKGARKREKRKEKTCKRKMLLAPPPKKDITSTGTTLRPFVATHDE